MNYDLNDRQVAHILLGLRALQDPQVYELMQKLGATDLILDGHDPMSDDEIDALCDDLNVAPDEGEYLGELIDCLRQGKPALLTSNDARKIAEHCDVLDDKIFALTHYSRPAELSDRVSDGSIHVRGPVGVATVTPCAIVDGEYTTANVSDSVDTYRISLRYHASGLEFDVAETPDEDNARLIAKQFADGVRKRSSDFT